MLSLVLHSIFVDDNILTAFVSTSMCKILEGTPCNTYITASLYCFYPKKHSLKLMKQFQISNGHYGDSLFYHALSIGNFTHVVLRATYYPFFDELDRCHFQNISLLDYEQEALNYLNSNAVTYAQVIVTAALSNGIIRLSDEMLPFNYEYNDWPSLGIDKVISFRLKSASFNSFKSSSYFFSFIYTSQGGIKPIVYATEDYLLTNSRTFHL